MTRCRICAGELGLKVPGSDAAPSADALSPSAHAVGGHADLFECRECGTVQQDPGRAPLRDLYRDMRDDAYLDEEAGRRATANRLLDLIGAHVPDGRLLDIGCGYGLLLDEARTRGYVTLGLELSRAAAGHARDALGLDVREVPLETFAASRNGGAPGTFDAIVLADVLEHLDDPVAALDGCAALLTPGGVLCVVTPDPSSATARLAGARWWGYLPGHTVLLPRRTLRELIAARGLVISADVPFVRTFAARRWVGGLAERSGRLRRPLGGVAEHLPPVNLSLSLGDERVILAHRTPVDHPVEPLLHGGDGVHVVLPAYKAVRTIPDVVREMPADAAGHALLVDDASPDATANVAVHHGLDVLRHPVNRGYGATQKTGYVRALRDGAQVVVMVHADNQYDPGLVAEMAAPILAGEADLVIGSRLLDDHAIAGGMPRWKWFGNRLLTGIENRAFGVRFSEYHTGYRAFSADLLRSIPFLRNSDDFVFDQEIFAQVLARGARVREIAIPTRYFHEASSVGVRTSLRYAFKTLWVLARFRLDRRWALLRRPAAWIG
ncbi:MAG TPA: methyltransferase domain-containing protein [Solirubrobacter sp.]|nr:methyltransferase domain-containing protein [Solirubrobacter sp.]